MQNQNESSSKQTQPAFDASCYDNTITLDHGDKVLQDVSLESERDIVVAPTPPTASPSSGNHPVKPVPPTVPFGTNDVASIYGSGIKQGHSFLGGCCDMRRAVIIVNAICITMEIIGLVVLLILFSIGFFSYPDNAAEYTIGDYTLTWGIVLGIVGGLSLFSIVFNAAGIHGATKYKQGFVMAALIYHAICLGLNVITFSIIGALVSGLFLYPHICLVKEMKEGIMTEANYHNEKQSCCCV